MSTEYRVKTQAKFQSICVRCHQRIRVGETIIQEETGKWSHFRICDEARKRPAETEEFQACTRKAID